MRLDAYRKATAPFEVLDVETFVVSDDVRAAGTFDRLVRCPDGRVRVADLKSGKSEADYPLATATQLATYANGKRYDPETVLRADPPPRPRRHRRPADPPPPAGGCRGDHARPRSGLAGRASRDEVHQFLRTWKAADLIVDDDLGGVA